MAQVLAADRSQRDAQRDADKASRREALDQRERERLAAIRAADAAYYPARSTLYSPFYARNFFPNIGERGLRRSRSTAGRYVYAPEARRSGPRRPPKEAPAAPREYRNIEPNFSRRP